MIGVAFSDAVTLQTLFYQVMLGDSLDLPCSPGGEWFEGGPQSYGYDTNVASFGDACLRPGNPPQSYRLDILPTVDHVIEVGQQDGLGGTRGLDQYLGNWYVSGLYVGSGILGSVVTTSRWQGVDLVGTPGQLGGSHRAQGSIQTGHPGPGTTQSAFTTQCSLDPALQGLDGYVIDLGTPATTVSVESSSPSAYADEVQLYLYDDKCQIVGESQDYGPDQFAVAATAPARYALVEGYAGAEISFTVGW